MSFLNPLTPLFNFLPFVWKIYLYSVRPSLRIRHHLWMTPFHREIESSPEYALIGKINLFNILKAHFVITRRHKTIKGFFTANFQYQRNGKENHIKTVPAYYSRKIVSWKNLNSKRLNVMKNTWIMLFFSLKSGKCFTILIQFMLSKWKDDVKKEKISFRLWNLKNASDTFYSKRNLDSFNKGFKDEES